MLNLFQHPVPLKKVKIKGSGFRTKFGMTPFRFVLQKAKVIKKTIRQPRKEDIQVENIIAAIEKMTVMELVELKKALEEKFGVKAAAPMAFAAAAAPVAEAAKVEEKTDFEIVLIAAGEKKIQVIKEIRAITQLGLKEAKDLVDGAPSTVKESAPKEEAEKIKAQLEAVGATVELK